MTGETVNKLFKDFTHIEHSNREKLNPTGVGLGLKIAYDLAKLLGPKDNSGITVESVPNKRSTFSFILENKGTSLNASSRSEPKEEQSPLVANEFCTDTESSLVPKITRATSTKSYIRFTKTEILSVDQFPCCSCAKVLVVDDDPFNILAYEAILNSLEINYECVYSGRSAIDKMLNRVSSSCSGNCHYKIVFMDEEMPGMTGKETVAEIISRQRQNQLPEMAIIGCTAHHDGKKIENILKSGVAECIPKPISIDIIKMILKKYNVNC